MGLVSPRFSANARLQQAAKNAPAIRFGERGAAVHLVQFALIELGYPMPISTGQIQASPDGIFGKETEAVVRKFQEDRKKLNSSITVDGVVGAQVLAELDALLPGYTRSVRLHFRSIALQNVPFESSLTSAQKVYAQYGIKIEFGSGQSLLLSDAQQTMFDKIDQECAWDLSSGEYAELQSLGTPVPATDIAVYYVKELKDAGGCGGHAPGRPAATVAANTTEWATAHEVGHVLLTSSFIPAHFVNTNNLMWDKVLYFSGTPLLTEKQVAQIRRSPCCKPI